MFVIVLLKSAVCSCVLKRHPLPHSASITPQELQKLDLVLFHDLCYNWIALLARCDWQTHIYRTIDRLTGKFWFFFCPKIYLQRVKSSNFPQQNFCTEKRRTSSQRTARGKHTANENEKLKPTNSVPEGGPKPWNTRTEVNPFTWTEERENNRGGRKW